MREKRLGLVLRLKPRAIENAIGSKYEDVFEQGTGDYLEGTDEYQCVKGLCVGSFQSLNRKYTVVFGLHAKRSFIGVARYGRGSWAS
jgi:hypothetical protein